jgi:O-methyltransferase
MIGKLNSVINGFVSPLGIEIKRRNSSSRKLREAVGEMEQLLHATMFPDLPQRSGRHELMTQLLGTSLSEAFHLIWHLNHVLNLEGAVCEFGVAQGATSALIANEIRETDKDFWLFDSFEGLPKPTDRDKLIDDIFDLGSIEKYQGTMACGQQQVIDRLNAVRFPFERVKVVPGFIETTAQYASLPKEVCFAYVDFDFYEPIKIVLELLDSRLSAGGVVIVDDYGFFSEGAQAAVDEFVEGHRQRYTNEPSPEWAGNFCVLTRKV